MRDKEKRVSYKIVLLLTAFTTDGLDAGAHDMMLGNTFVEHENISHTIIAIETTNETEMVSTLYQMLLNMTLPAVKIMLPIVTSPSRC